MRALAVASGVGIGALSKLLAMSRAKAGEETAGATTKTAGAASAAGAGAKAAEGAMENAGRVSRSASALKFAGSALKAAGLAGDAYMAGDLFWNGAEPALAKDDTLPGWMRQKITPEMRQKQAYLASLEKKYGLPSGLLDSIWGQESWRGKYAKNSPKGAQGEFQIMPKIAEKAGIDPHNFQQAAEYAAKRMRDDMTQYNGFAPAMLAEYNWGPGNLGKARAQYGDKWLSHAPKETRDYVANIQMAMETANKQSSSRDNGGSTNIHAPITINAPNGDAKAIAREVGSAFTSLTFRARQAGIRLT